MAHPRIDMVGRRFGRLVVQDVAGMEQSSGHRTWACLCDCGAQHTASGRDLRKGATQSCGCLRRELSSARSKQMHEARRAAREGVAA